MEFFTIGVYNSTENDFFDKLIDNKIDTFCDIRQRRGVRGATYAFVNSNRLQTKLNDLGIRYEYVQELAPVAEVRAIQKGIDKEKGDTQTGRTSLGEIFIDEFNNQILNGFDFDAFFNNLKGINAQRVVLFCVEEKAEACHRSIVSERIKKEFGLKTTHL